MKIKILIFSAVCLFALAPINAAKAAESLSDFSSDITVNNDGSLTVVETITAVAEHVDIKHGIYRDLILDYQGPDKDHYYQVNYSIVSVKRNGVTEPYHLANAGSDIRIYIGDPNRLVPIGSQVYELTYKAYGLMRYLSDSDELYWNVTGNDWQFPIERAEAKVTLPWQRADYDVFYSYNYSYIGSQGSTAEAGQFLSQENSLTYLANQPMNPGEGFSIVLGFPKGRIATMLPTLKEVRQQAQLFNSVPDIDRIRIMGGFSLFVTLYFLLAWYFFGRDRRNGVIVAQYEAPTGLSPCDVALISKMGSGINEALAAILVSLAVKGKIKITKKTGFFAFQDWQFDRLNEMTDGLSEEEKMLFDNLFKRSGTVSLPTTDFELTNFLRWKMLPFLNKKWAKIAYVKNTPWLIVGTLLSVMMVLVYFILSNSPNFFILLFLTMPSYAVISTLYTAIKKLSSGGLSFAAVGSLVVTILVVIGISVLFVLPVWGLFSLSSGTWLVTLASNWHYLMIVPAVVANMLAFKFIRRPTDQGRQLMDQIEGFKLFLVTTEKDRMEFFHPIQQVPDVFEKYFPYAIALGVADKWIARFGDMFQQANVNAGYTPLWYGGSLSGMSGMNSLSSIGTSLGSSLASSGGSGGGGSGGGGSGGGGGGW